MGLGEPINFLEWVWANPSVFWNGFIKPINFMGCSKKKGTYFEERILLSSRYDILNPSFENPNAAIETFEIKEIIEKPFDENAESTSCKLQSCNYAEPLSLPFGDRMNQLKYESSCNRDLSRTH